MRSNRTSYYTFFLCIFGFGLLLLDFYKTRFLVNILILLLLTTKYYNHYSQGLVAAEVVEERLEVAMRVVFALEQVVTEERLRRDEVCP